MDLLKRRACMTGLILYNFFLKVQMIFFICMKFKIIIYFFFTLIIYLSIPLFFKKKRSNLLLIWAKNNAIKGKFKID
jgi:hypothetical protein